MVATLPGVVTIGAMGLTLVDMVVGDGGWLLNCSEQMPEYVSLQEVAEGQKLQLGPRLYMGAPMILPASP